MIEYIFLSKLFISTMTLLTPYSHIFIYIYNYSILSKNFRLKIVNSNFHPLLAKQLQGLCANQRSDQIRNWNQ